MIQQEDKTTIAPIATFQAHKDYLTRVLLSPDVKHLATCSADHTAKVWSLDADYPPARAALEERERTNNILAQQQQQQSSPTSRNPGPMHHSVTQHSLNPGITDARENGNLNGEGAAEIEPSSTFSYASKQSSDGEQSENDGSSSLSIPLDPLPMDPVTNTLYLETVLANHQRWVWDCAFSADSAYLVTVCSDHYARLWELASGQIIRQYSGHHRGAVCVALNDYSEPR